MSSIAHKSQHNTGAQWEHLDDLLKHEHKLVKRATLGRASNLMSHKSHLPALFNWENIMSRKGFEQVVELTRLHDVKSQSSAIRSSSYAITFQFIGEALLQSERLKENIVKIADEQNDDAALMEQTALMCCIISCSMLMGLMICLPAAHCICGACVTLGAFSFSQLPAS